MAERFFGHSHRLRWRLTLLLLVTIPLLPEIVILATATLATLQGCRPAQTDVCLLVSRPVSDILALALQAGAGWIVAATSKPDALTAIYVGLAAWLVACLVVVTFGWARISSRLLLGLAVALTFAVLPYFGPMLALEPLVHSQCKPNDGYVGPCTIFGGDVGTPAHAAVSIGWLGLVGTPLAMGIFAVYAIAVILLAVVLRKHPVASA